jgi:ketosteroid isomerase-like protein
VKRFLLVVLLSTIACTARPNLDAERTAILRTDSTWLAAVQTGNIDSTLGFWTEDARVISPNQPPVIGRAAIREMLLQSAQMPGFSVSWRTTDVVVAPSGEIGYSFGTNLMTVPSAAGGVDTLRGQGVVVWRKGNDGRWRSAVDTWTPRAP